MIFTVLYRIKEKFSHVGRKWDAMAPTKEQAIEFAHTHINLETKRMTDAVHYSMEYCLAHSGESINERYRQNRADETDIKIAEMVAQNTTDTDLILYRGVCDYVYPDSAKLKIHPLHKMPKIRYNKGIRIAEKTEPER